MTERSVDIDSERLAQLLPRIALRDSSRVGITSGAIARAHRAVRKRPNRRAGSWASTTAR
jgi:hypothetical protein